MRIATARLLLVGALLWTGGCNPSVEQGEFSRPPSTTSASSNQRPPWLVDVSEAVGLDFSREQETEGSYFMPEIMGSGGGFLDFDADGLLDIVLLDAIWGGGGEQTRSRVRLYRQSPPGHFQEVSPSAGFREFASYAVGLAIGDYDSDGDSDLFVSCLGPDVLYNNQGDGTFLESSQHLSVRDPRWGTAATFFDYDRDGFLDLYVVNYLDYFPGNPCDDSRQRPDYCGPQAFQGTLGKLYRNLGEVNSQGQVLLDVSAVSGLAAGPAGPGLGLLCRDFNGDLRPDIYVAYDQHPNPLFLQQPDGKFREAGANWGLATNGLGQPQASMGITTGDFNGDSLFDLFITNIRGEVNILYLATRQETFRDGTSKSGIASASLTRTGFGAVALDLDLDGDLDLAVVNGRVKRDAPLPGSNVSSFWNDYAEPAQLLRNDGQARFEDVSAWSGEWGSRHSVSRALATADFDNDGDLDLLSTTCGGPASLWQNKTPREGRWLRVRLTDSQGNREGYGARVTVRAGERQWIREMNPSTSYLSSHDPRLHFGLGDTLRYDSIEVEWSDGTRQLAPAGDTDRELIIGRGRRVLVVTTSESQSETSP
jgi:hypothetical protein